MTCREVIEFLMEYRSGDLLPAERQAFEEHLAECEACVAYIKTYEDAVNAGKAVFSHPDDELPEDVPEDLVKAILAARKKV